MTNAANVTTCNLCLRPVHASETNDDGNHPTCEYKGLADQMPVFRGWKCSYEFPGQIEFRHPHAPNLVIYATPDFTHDGWLAVQVSTDDSRRVQVEGRSDPGAEIPFPVRTAEALLAAVIPWLRIHQPKHPGLARVMEALQALEGAEGPEGDEYLSVLEHVVGECERRSNAYQRSRS